MDFSSLFTAQNRRLFKLTMALSGGQELLLESFVGQEGLSSDFGFQLVCCFTSTNENIVYAHLKPTRE
ncbi:hypothetical protein, partial [Pseudomonas savastanoi]|uniref:hypothetical protein n=1 Tax=Pseudomonas savastanoi TaxID=29438 RepID=UPI000F3BBDE1